MSCVKRCLFSAISGIVSVTAFCGCQTYSQTASSQIKSPDSVRYLGASPNETVPGGADSSYYPSTVSADPATPLLEDTRNLQETQQQRQERRVHRQERRSTGLAYVGEGMYNVFVRPIKSLSEPKTEDRSKRNWLGMKISDDVPGVPAPADRMKQIAALGQAAGRVDQQREESYITALTTIIKSDLDSNCRAEAVKAVAKFNVPSAAYALNLALTDKAKHVRIAACNAWAKRSNPKDGAEAINALLVAEDDKDVSLAAIHALSACGQASSNEALGRMLATSDPALQIAAMNSLGTIHSNPSRDLEQWRQYCRGEIQAPVEEQKKTSIAERLNIWK